VSAAPGPRASKAPQLKVGLAVGAACAIAGLEILALVLFSPAGVVFVNNPIFEYDTPPTYFCPYTETSGNQPPPYLEVRAGSVFNLSWDIGCEPYGPGNTTGAEYVITSVTSSTYGFRVVSSNLPVVFGYNLTGQFNVSVRAPAVSTYSYLILAIQGGPLPSASEN
jgi:hypothetical protein